MSWRNCAPCFLATSANLESCSSSAAPPVAPSLLASWILPCDQTAKRWNQRLRGAGRGGFSARKRRGGWLGTVPPAVLLGRMQPHPPSPVGERLHQHLVQQVIDEALDEHGYGATERLAGGERVRLARASCAAGPATLALPARARASPGVCTRAAGGGELCACPRAGWAAPLEKKVLRCASRVAGVSRWGPAGRLLLRRAPARIDGYGAACAPAALSQGQRLPFGGPRGSALRRASAQ
jgi:hypothetical protein